MRLNILFHLMSRLRVSGALPPLPACLQGAYRDDCTVAVLLMFIAVNIFDADIPSIRCASILFWLIITVIFYYYLF